MLETLDKYVEQGLLRKAENEHLAQYNYTDITNNEAKWDDVTLYNRGCIYEKSSGNLVARAMPKFFNLDQLPEQTREHLYTKKFKSTEKLDGCFGVIYKYNGQICYNGRGSFEGFVVDAIAEMINKYDLDEVLNTCNLNVEVIHPSTKIIVDYGNTHELVLITAFSNGRELTRLECEDIARKMQMPIVQEQTFTWESLLDWTTKAGYNEEGFVLTFDYDDKEGCFFRVKVKSLEYIQAAAFRKNLNKHYIWKMMKNDLYQNTTSLDSYLHSVPDEIYKTALNWQQELQNDLNNLVDQVTLEYKQYEHLTDKQLGLSNLPNKHKFFAIRKGHNISKLLIDQIEPSFDFDSIGGENDE